MSVLPSQLWLIAGVLVGLFCKAPTRCVQSTAIVMSVNQHECTESLMLCYCNASATVSRLCFSCITSRSRGKAEKGRTSHLPPAAVVFELRRDGQVPFWAHVGVQEHQLACDHVTSKLCNQDGQGHKQHLAAAKQMGPRQVCVPLVQGSQI